MAKKKIKDVVAEALEDFMKEEGYELYNVEFVKEGKDWFLRVYVDKVSQEKEEYISIEDCEKVSRYLSEKLDSLDPIAQNYYLEVSSPGMDRELIEDKHFKRFIGSDIEVKLYRAIDGDKNIEAKLVGFDEGLLSLDKEGEILKINREDVAKAKLMVVF